MRSPRVPRFTNPYDAPGRWWKVGLHMHTTNSDGHRTPTQVAGFYRRRAYDAIAITDHHHVTRIPGWRGRPVLIPAAELTGPPDLLYLGARASGPLPWHGQGFQGTLDRIRRAGGVAVVAHPSWSGLDAETVRARSGYAAVELWNGVAQDLNGRGWSLELWDHLLQRGRRVWGMANDDAHFDAWRGRAGRAWLWVKAPALTVPALLRAIRIGAFHATTGPRVLSLAVRGARLTLRTTPATRVHLISAGIGAGGLRRAGGSGATTWTFDILRERLNVTTYVRFEVLDRAGRRAWTNPLFVNGRGVRFW